MTRDRDPLFDALHELEALAPVSPPPELRPSAARRWPWAVGGLATAAALMAGVLFWLPGNDGIGEVPPTPSPTATASPTPDLTVEPTVEPTTTAEPTATSGPTPTTIPTLTPVPTAEPRAGWTTRPLDLGDTASPGGVRELDGRLFVTGAEIGDTLRPAIWWSDDAMHWERAVVRRPERDDGSPLGGRVFGIVSVQDALVAVAAFGHAEGSGFFATMVYTSVDGGRTWSFAQSIPALEGSPMFTVAIVGDRVVVAGWGVWVSDDAGRTWHEAASGDEIGGRVFSLVSHGDVLVGWGPDYPGDLTGPPEAAWISTDRGNTWRQFALRESGPFHAWFTRDGVLRIPMGDDVLRSIDYGESWEREPAPAACCPHTVLETNSGFVAAYHEYGTPTTQVLTSSDGTHWSTESLDLEIYGLSWSPGWGLIGYTESGDIVFGPVPYP